MRNCFGWGGAFTPVASCSRTPPCASLAAALDVCSNTNPALLKNWSNNNGNIPCLGWLKLFVFKKYLQRKQSKPVKDKRNTCQDCLCLAYRLPICLLWKKNIISTFSRPQLYPSPFLRPTQEILPKDIQTAAPAAGRKELNNLSRFLWAAVVSSTPNSDSKDDPTEKLSASQSVTKPLIKFTARFPFFFQELCLY